MIGASSCILNDFFEEKHKPPKQNMKEQSPQKLKMKRRSTLRFHKHLHINIFMNTSNKQRQEHNKLTAIWTTKLKGVGLSLGRPTHSHWHTFKSSPLKK